MKVLLTPGAPICGVCGNIMMIRRDTDTPTPSPKATVFCAMLTCPERRKRYVLEYEVRELELAPTQDAV